ncbi:hypothetical protein [Paracoccus aminophilus]|nr:hypothetical protein [Paracoccus aminophilus]
MLRLTLRLEIALQRARSLVPEYVAAREGTAPDLTAVYRLKVHRDEVLPLLQQLKEDLYIIRVIRSPEGELALSATEGAIVRALSDLISKVRVATGRLVGYDEFTTDILLGRRPEAKGKAVPPDLEKEIDLAISRQGIWGDAVASEFAALLQKLTNYLQPLVKAEYSELQ